MEGGAGVEKDVVVDRQEAGDGVALVHTPSSHARVTGCDCSKSSHTVCVEARARKVCSEKRKLALSPFGKPHKTLPLPYAFLHMYPVPTRETTHGWNQTRKGRSTHPGR